MSDTIPTPMTTDPTGTAQPVGTVPSASNVPTPATAAVPTTPQDSTNAPDAQTPAAKSIPANLVNNPQVPSQKLATQADANKNSPPPERSWPPAKPVVRCLGPHRVSRSPSSGGCYGPPRGP